MGLPWVNLESPPKPDADYIRTMFDRMARRYDAFTLLTGFGQAQRWRRETLKPVRPGMRVLDLGCGTGDLAIAAAEAVGPDGEVVGLDFSPRMLDVAQRKFQRLRGKQSGRFRPFLGRAEDLPIDGQRFDLIVSGFVLRNLYARIGRILQGVHASLKPGGLISFLDLTEPSQPFLRDGFRLYLLTMVGLYGAVLFRKDYPILYLPDSARRFFAAHEFASALEHAGFASVTARSFMFGTVTLYQAQENPRQQNVSSYHSATT